MKLGMVFPGQGSQSVGMLQALVDQYPVARDTFAEASDALGYDLGGMMLGGPEADLNRTQNTQPAVLVAAVPGVLVSAGRFEPLVEGAHRLAEDIVDGQGYGAGLGHLVGDLSLLVKGVGIVGDWLFGQGRRRQVECGDFGRWRWRRPLPSPSRRR